MNVGVPANKLDKKYPDKVMFTNKISECTCIVVHTPKAKSLDRTYKNTQKDFYNKDWYDYFFLNGVPPEYDLKYFFRGVVSVKLPKT